MPARLFLNYSCHCAGDERNGITNSWKITLAAAIAALRLNIRESPFTPSSTPAAAVP
jgi:hypothetical protein